LRLQLNGLSDSFFFNGHAGRGKPIIDCQSLGLNPLARVAQLLPPKTQI
jgi:hypothetical protein